MKLRLFSSQNRLLNADLHLFFLMGNSSQRLFFPSPLLWSHFCPACAPQVTEPFQKPRWDQRFASNVALSPGNHTVCCQPPFKGSFRGHHRFFWCACSCWRTQVLVLFPKITHLFSAWLFSSSSELWYSSDASAGWR